MAAIHAIIMVSMRQLLKSKQLEFVSIATAGLGFNAPEIPVWPMTWDEDCDAVLAIAGTGFLMVTPMMIWSGTFQQAFQKHRNRPILVGWVILLFIGLFCAIKNEVYVDMWAVGKFQFCSADGPLPDLNLTSGFSLRGREHPGKSFNDTVWDIFSNPQISQGIFPTCLYPCFDVTWPLRQRSSIKVIPSSETWPSTSNYSNVQAGRLFAPAAIAMLCASIFIIIPIFILHKRHLLIYGDRGHLTTETHLPRWLEKYVKTLDWGAKGFVGVSFFLFLAWSEYTMPPYPYAERFADIGQWSQFLSVVIILSVAGWWTW